MILKRFGFLLGISVLLTFGGAASAKAVTFNVTGHFENNEFFFMIQGLEGKNPKIPVTAGDDVTIVYKTVSNVHNFYVSAPINKKTAILTDDKPAETITFTIPADMGGKTIDYWCEPHKGIMQNVFEVASDPNAPAPSKANEAKSPGFEAVVALSAVALAVVALRRRA